MSEIDATSDADLFLRETRLLGVTAALAGGARHLEGGRVLVVALEGHQFVGLVAFHHAVQFDALHHVREGVKNLVPPDERRG